jgi:hypothetical protein
MAQLSPFSFLHQAPSPRSRPSISNAVSLSSTKSAPDWASPPPHGAHSTLPSPRRDWTPPPGKSSPAASMSTPRRRLPGWPPILSFSASHCTGGSHGPRSRPNTILVQAKPDMAQAQVRLPACPLQPHHPFEEARLRGRYIAPPLLLRIRRLLRCAERNLPAS